MPAMSDTDTPSDTFSEATKGKKRYAGFPSCMREREGCRFFVLQNSVVAPTDTETLSARARTGCLPNRRNGTRKVTRCVVRGVCRHRSIYLPLTAHCAVCAGYGKAPARQDQRVAEHASRPSSSGMMLCTWLGRRAGSISSRMSSARTGVINQTSSPSCRKPWNTSGYVLAAQRACLQVKGLMVDICRPWTCRVYGKPQVWARRVL